MLKNISAVTVLSYLEDYGKDCTGIELKNAYDFPANLNHSAALLTALGGKLASRKKVNGQNIFKITKAGKDYIKKNRDNIQPMDELKEISKQIALTKLEKKHAPKAAATPMMATGRSANEAIEGISKLIEDNQYKEKLLHSIFLMLKPLFEEEENDGCEEGNIQPN